MRLAVASIATALLAALCLASHLASTYEPPAQVPAPTEQIQEDEPNSGSDEDGPRRRTPWEGAGAVSSMEQQVRILTGDDSMFVFDADDSERIRAQALVMMAANMDVDSFTLKRESWERVRPKLGDEIEVNDYRRESYLHEDES